MGTEPIFIGLGEIWGQSPYLLGSGEIWGQSPYLLGSCFLWLGLSRAASFFGSYPAAQHVLDLVDESARAQWAPRARVQPDALKPSVVICLGDQLAPLRQLPLRRPPARQQRVFPASNMALRTRPLVVPCPHHEPRPHRVALYITRRRQRVPAIHHAREKTTLPQVARLRVLPIEMLRVAHVGVGQCPPERAVLTRHGHKMYVVGHKAIGQYVDAVFVAVLLEKLKISLPVIVVQEDFRAAIAPLCDMMREPRRYNSCCPRHENNPTRRLPPCQEENMGSVPMFFHVFPDALKTQKDII